MQLEEKLRKLICCVIIALLLPLTGCGQSEEVSRASSISVSDAERASSETEWGEMPSLETESTESLPEALEEPKESEENAEETAESSDSPTVSPSVLIRMVGDVLLHTPVAESGKTSEGDYSFDHLFAHTGELIAAADLAMVNQEVIIGGAELKVSGYPAFNAPYELGDALVAAGFDVVLHATNHALDKGKKGLMNCLNFWTEHYPDIQVLGIHATREDADDIFVYEKDGIRIAIVNYTYGTNGIKLPEDMPFGVDLLGEKKLIEDLERAEELADFTICCPHWGTEYVLEQTKNQRRWAGLMVQHGADLILGTHPHVIEPVCGYVQEGDAWVEKQAWEIDFTRGKAALCFYSLGNYVNWTSGTGSGTANRMVGAMADVTLERNDSGEVVIRDWKAIPLVSHLEKGFGGVTVYPLEEYSSALAEKNEIRRQDSTFSYAYCVELVRSVLGDSFAPLVQETEE